MSSRFEFLGDTILGQYLPLATWFHHRDPRARLLCFVFLFIGLIFAPEIWTLILGLTVVLLIYTLAELPLKPALSGIKRALPFIVILALLQIIFLKPAESAPILWEIFGLSITRGVLLSAVNLILRFLALIILINAFVMSLSTSQVTAALYHLLKPLEKVRFPVNDLMMVVQITMRYIPLIAQMAEKTAKAQAARGADWEKKGFNPIKQAKRVIPLIVPLIVNSLERAETMALAMESRGFNAAHQRSSFYILHFTWQDFMLMVISLVLTTAILFLGRFV